VRVVRRRLFWKIYLTLLASLVVAAVALGTFFFFLGEAQREGRGSAASWPLDMTQFAADGHFIGARGQPIAASEYEPGHRFGPGHVARFDLPGGGFVLARLGPPPGERMVRLLAVILAVVGGVGLAAYPITALITRRLEALRFRVEHWGEGRTPTQLDDRGSDEVALLAHAFNQAAGRLDALLKSQKALLANASHELRSPLARLRVAVEVGGVGDAASCSRAPRAEIVRNLAEMDELVDELLLSSRLEHLEGRDDRRETVDLLGLAAEEAVRYEAVVAGEPVEIVGEPILLRRLVRNLLENGARHGRPPIDITVLSDANGATITVGDAGEGVAPQDRERIFEPFYRPAGSSERTGGWGLGLALVRQIAERHGGRVECVGALCGGSRFVVHLASGKDRPSAGA